MWELLEDGVTKTTTTTKVATMELDSKANARAKEAKGERAKESAKIADQAGISRESALDHTRAKAKTKACKENATTAEKLDIEPASAPRAEEMKQEFGAQEDTKKPGTKEDSRERAKESGKLMEMKHKDILIGTSGQRGNRVRRQMSWTKTGTRSSRGAASWAISCRIFSQRTGSPIEDYAGDRFADRGSKTISGSAG